MVSVLRWLFAGVALVSCTSAQVRKPDEPLPASEPRARRALLVGINDYESALREGRSAPPGRGFRNLHGAAGDAIALGAMLVSRFGFRSEDVVVLTDGAATRQAILHAFEHHLLLPARPGDQVVFYFGGHGSRVANRRSDEPDGLDETLVPADAASGARDLRDKELRRLLNRLLDRGAEATVVLDSCHSGSGARGLPTGLEPRALAPDPRPVEEVEPFGPDPAERGAVILSAAQDDEFAWETRGEDGAVHGAFTWALLQALRDGRLGEPAEETFLRTRARLQSELRRQEPVLETTAAGRLRSLFASTPGAPSEGVVVAVERLDGDGSVILQGGWVHGLRIGSRVSWTPSGGESQELEIVEMLGLARARARTSTRSRQRGLEPAPGTLVTVTRWAASTGKVLRVALPVGPADGTGVTILARDLATAVSGKGVHWVEDPTRESPTRVLRFAGDRWQLLGPGLPAMDFGAAPSVNNLLAHLPPGSRFFLQLPVPPALAAAFEIGPGATHDGIHPTADLDAAVAILTGRFRAGEISYAWIRPDSASEADFSVPLATPWRTVAVGYPAEVLREDLFHLRKLHGWFTLETPAQGDFGYRLTMTQVGASRPHQDGELLAAGELVEFRLERRAEAPETALRPRYLYLFLIDAHGDSVLLFGFKTDHNPLPVTSGSSQPPAVVLLGQGPRLRIKAPFGPDSVFLLTSDEPLTTPWLLQYRGFRPRGPRGATALDELLSLTGGTTRGGEALLTPVAWSIERLSFVSVADAERGSAGSRE